MSKKNLILAFSLKKWPKKSSMFEILCVQILPTKISLLHTDWNRAKSLKSRFNQTNHDTGFNLEKCQNSHLLRVTMAYVMPAQIFTSFWKIVSKVLRLFKNQTNLELNFPKQNFPIIWSTSLDSDQKKFSSNWIVLLSLTNVISQIFGTFFPVENYLQPVTDATGHELLVIDKDQLNVFYHYLGVWVQR